MSIGRNDPCPCGSGRKYKKCHGAPDREAVSSPEATRATALKACDVELGDRLMRFARLHHGPHWLEDALDAEDLLVDGELLDAEMPFVIPWLRHFRMNAHELTLADEWEHQERRLSTDERLLMKAYRAAWVSIWEVAEVEPGIGSRLVDVLTREERYVHDVRSSFTLHRYDSLLAIIVTCDGVSFFGGAHAQPLPPRFAEQAVREARRMCRVRTRPVSAEKLRDPDMQLELLALWSAIAANMLNQPPPVMQNTDGDPLVLTKDDFALVASRGEVAERLSTLSGVEEPEEEGDDTVFVVTKVGNATHRSWDNTIIGRIVLSEKRLIVETNSTRRADALRSAIETQLQGLARFRLRKEENTLQLMEAARAAPAPRAEPVNEPPPEAIAALRQFRERHMKDWLDMAIPALGGLTPRDAARSPRARPKLEILLKEIEQSEERLPERQRIDLRWMRVALELG